MNDEKVHRNGMNGNDCEHSFCPALGASGCRLRGSSRPLCKRETVTKNSSDFWGRLSQVNFCTRVQVSESCEATNIFARSSEAAGSNFSSSAVVCALSRRNGDANLSELANTREVFAGSLRLPQGEGARRPNSRLT
jgi:hypothetical protein